MAATPPNGQPRKVFARLDYSDGKRPGLTSSTSSANLREPLKARVRADASPSSSPSLARARLAGSPVAHVRNLAPDTPPNTSLPSSISSRTVTDNSPMGSAGKGKRVRGMSADPESPSIHQGYGFAPQAVFQARTPPVTGMTRSTSTLSTPATARKVFGSPLERTRSRSPTRIASPSVASPSLTSTPASPRSRQRLNSFTASTYRSPSPAFSSSLASPPALSTSSSTESGPSTYPIRPASPVRSPSPIRRSPSPTRRSPSPTRRPPSPVRRPPLAQSVSAPRSAPKISAPALSGSVTMRHRKTQSACSSMLSTSITSASAASSASGRIEEENERAMWLQARREEEDERDARVKRKIMDLEITNNSLTAVNATLERTKSKQAAEIRDLRRLLRDQPLPSPHLSSLMERAGSHASTGPPTPGLTIDEEEEDWETVLKEDPTYADALRLVEELIAQASRACTSIVSPSRAAPRVLQPRDVSTDAEEMADTSGSSVEEDDHDDAETSATSAALSDFPSKLVDKATQTEEEEETMRYVESPIPMASTGVASLLGSLWS